MALTVTDRLNLPKQDLGDLSWHTEQNDGMDDADARLLKLSSIEGVTDPNIGPIAGDYAGQRFIDEGANPPRVWICTTDSTPGPSVWRLISTRSIESPTPIGGITSLDLILLDDEARLVALETAAPIYDRAHIDGLITYYIDATTLGVQFGEATDNLKTSRLSVSGANRTKTTGTYVAGEGLGGMTATEIPLSDGEWYHIFIVHFIAGDVTDIAFDSSPIAANLEGTEGVDSWRLIGSFKLNEAAVTLRPWFQFEDDFCWDTPLLDQSYEPFTTQLISLDKSVPPDLRTKVSFNYHMEAWDFYGRVYFLEHPVLDATVLPSDDAAPLASARLGPSAGNSDSQKHSCWTNVSQEIKGVRGDSVITTLNLSVLSYRHPRGKHNLT